MYHNSTRFIALLVAAGCASSPSDAERADVPDVPDTSGSSEVRDASADVASDGTANDVADTAATDLAVFAPDSYGPADTAGLQPSPANGTCVPHGDRFVDTYRCAEVNGPSGDTSLPTNVGVSDPDPARLDDPDLEWTRQQIEGVFLRVLPRIPWRRRRPQWRR